MVRQSSNHTLRLPFRDMATAHNYGTDSRGHIRDNEKPADKQGHETPTRNFSRVGYIMNLDCAHQWARTCVGHEYLIVHRSSMEMYVFRATISSAALFETCYLHTIYCNDNQSQPGRHVEQRRSKEYGMPSHPPSFAARHEK